MCDGEEKASQVAASMTAEERIRRAEAALGDLSKNYRPVATAAIAEAQALLAAAEKAKQAQAKKQSLQELYRIMHDLKGQGASVGYRLVSDIGQLMCRLLRSCGDDPDPRTLEVARAHLTALERVIEHDIKSDGGEGGRRLLQRLAGLIEGATQAAPGQEQAAAKSGQ